MWHGDWRNRFWQQLGTPFDVLVIGGGITGAGVLLAAAQRGWRAALIEQRDFAWGSSSRSSKLVHGGLRYLKQGRFGLTRSALKERNALLRDYPDLVVPRRFFLPFERHASPLIRSGLAMYDALAGQHSRDRHDRDDWLRWFPPLRHASHQGALSYLDAATDDCQLVLHVLRQAAQLGASSCNYAQAISLRENRQGVSGVVVQDAVTGKQHEIRAQIVVDATGAWSGRLTPAALHSPRMRPLRGSHLVLPFTRLPLTEAVGCRHPVDGRPVYAVPWAGAILFGTTDVDHASDLQAEPHISAAEYDYLMVALRSLFPGQALDEQDILSSFAGVRPTFADGHRAPSAASREHLIREARGWISISGGKLTTFRHMANAVLHRAEKQLRKRMTPLPIEPHATEPIEWQPHFLGTSTCSTAQWRSALVSQAVLHLDDLMLRRTRLGLTHHDGGLAVLAEQREALCIALGWNSSHWQQEYLRYLDIRQRHYAPRAFAESTGALANTASATRRTR